VGLHNRYKGRFCTEKEEDIPVVERREKYNFIDE